MAVNISDRESASTLSIQDTSGYSDVIGRLVEVSMYRLDTETKGHTLFMNARAPGCSARA